MTTPNYTLTQLFTLIESALTRKEHLDLGVCAVTHEYVNNPNAGNHYYSVSWGPKETTVQSPSGDVFFKATTKEHLRKLVLDWLDSLNQELSARYPSLAVASEIKPVPVPQITPVSEPKASVVPKAVTQRLSEVRLREIEVLRPSDYAKVMARIAILNPKCNFELVHTILNTYADPFHYHKTLMGAAQITLDATYVRRRKAKVKQLAQWNLIVKHPTTKRYLLTGAGVEYLKIVNILIELLEFTGFSRDRHQLLRLPYAESNATAFLIPNSNHPSYSCSVAGTSIDHNLN